MLCLSAPVLQCRQGCQTQKPQQEASRSTTALKPTHGSSTAAQLCLRQFDGELFSSVWRWISLSNIKSLGNQTWFMMISIFWFFDVHSKCKACDVESKACRVIRVTSLDSSQGTAVDGLGKARGFWDPLPGAGSWRSWRRTSHSARLRQPWKGKAGQLTAIPKTRSGYGGESCMAPCDQQAPCWNRKIRKLISEKVWSLSWQLHDSFTHHSLWSADLLNSWVQDQNKTTRPKAPLCEPQKAAMTKKPANFHKICWQPRLRRALHCHPVTFLRCLWQKWQSRGFTAEFCTFFFSMFFTEPLLCGFFRLFTFPLSQMTSKHRLVHKLTRLLLRKSEPYQRPSL